MAFRLAKASGARVPDLVDDLVGDATSLAIDNIENGILVTFGADGELEQAATGDNVVGIIVNEPGSTRYASPSGVTYTPTFIDTDKITVLPVTGTVPIEADVSGDDTYIIPGAELDFEATGWTVVGAAAPVNGDFRVVRVYYDAAGDAVSVIGFFVNPGYFTA